jgi:hypothetical protein
VTAIRVEKTIETHRGRLTATYDGSEHRLTVEETRASSALGADTIALDEHDAQELAAWLARDAADEYRGKLQDQTYHPGTSRSRSSRDDA